MWGEFDDLLQDLDVGVDVKATLVIDGLEEEHTLFRSHRVSNLGSKADKVLGVVTLESHDLFPYVFQCIEIVGLDVPSDDASVVVECLRGLSLLVEVLCKLIENLCLLEVDLH